MRTYEYRCRTCGRHFEVNSLDMENDTIPECPYCQSRDSELKLSSLFAPKKDLSPLTEPVKGSTVAASNCGSPGPFS